MNRTIESQPTDFHRSIFARIVLWAIVIAAAITANRTLGGAVEWAQPGSASFEDVEFEGAAAARAAAIPVTLWFTVAGSPLA